jgi:murein DD-endopeptidase MepM/ murein hydrolase activator NlpD
MRKTLFFLFFITSVLFGDVVEERVWEKNKTLLNFLEDNQIPLSLYYNLAPEDKELVEEIISGEEYYASYDDEFTTLKQALIPIGGENQIHIYKEPDGYNLKISPVNYGIKKDFIVVEINSSLYKDIYDLTNDNGLASEIISSFKNSVNFKRYIQKGDFAVASYESKIRLGKRYGVPTVHTAMVETAKSPHYVFLYEDGRYYDENGKEIEGFNLRVPVSYSRISSNFTKSRYHPVLKRYRPHLGIDYAAPRGTKVRSAAEGRVVFKGRKGGYGNTVIVQHDYGYRTLYAHLKGYRGSLKRGEYVKKGELLGYVGSTGLSTGPHLHFGLYKNQRAINPNKAIVVVKNKLEGTEMKKFMQFADEKKREFVDYIAAYEEGKYRYNPTYLAFYNKDSDLSDAR